MLLVSAFRESMRQGPQTRSYHSGVCCYKEQFFKALDTVDSTLATVSADTGSILTKVDMFCKAEGGEGRGETFSVLPWSDGESNQGPVCGTYDIACSQSALSIWHRQKMRRLQIFPGPCPLASVNIFSS